MKIKYDKNMKICKKKMVRIVLRKHKMFICLKEELVSLSAFEKMK